MNSKDQYLTGVHKRNIKEFFGPAQFDYVSPWLNDFVKNGPNNNEQPGFVYVYARANDIKQYYQGDINHIILHKIGYTVRNAANTRIAEQ